MAATKSPRVLEALRRIHQEGEKVETASSEPEKEVVIPKVKPKYDSGKQKFSKVFGFKPPSGIDHAVEVFATDHWNEDVQQFIPTITDGWIWPKESTEKVVVALITGDKSLIIGPTGSGKSDLVKNVCAVLNIPFIRVNFFTQVEYSSVFGMPDMKDGNLGYNHGPIGELGIHGGVLCLDEFSAATSDITMSLQYVLEDNGRIYLPDYPGTAKERMITPHKDFRIVCTDNTELQGDTTGRYAGTNVQNTATLDRFNTIIRHDYLKKIDEKKVIQSRCPDLPEEILEKMLQLAVHVRAAAQQNSVNLTMSPRTLINWGKKITYWGDPVIALQLSFFDKLTEDDRKLVGEFVRRVFGKDI